MTRRNKNLVQGGLTAAELQRIADVQAELEQMRRELGESGEPSGQEGELVIPNGPLLLARKVGALSANHTMRYSALAERLSGILPELDHKKIIGKSALRLILLTKEEVQCAANRLRLPVDEALREMLRSLPSKDQTFTGKVTGGIARYRTDDVSQKRHLRDICLRVESPGIHDELLKLMEFVGSNTRHKLSVPIATGDSLAITDDQCEQAGLAAKIAFERQWLTFEPLMPMPAGQES